MLCRASEEEENRKFVRSTGKGGRRKRLELIDEETEEMMCGRQQKDNVVPKKQSVVEL